MQLLSTPRPLTRRRTVRLLAALCCAALPVLGAATRPSAASAAATEVLGNATHFDGLGSPYGGCGLPQRELDSQDFVALNVFNTPGDYSGSYPRPVPDSRASIKGVFDNGRNCGRWVKVTIGDYCTGTNDGAPGQAFCRNGSWVADTYEGATLTMLVADSCADSNAWCRDDPNHLDLATDSLNRFRTGTTPVGTMYPDHWNNRHVSWSFVPAPDYSGDIRIGFLRGAQRYLGSPTSSVRRPPAEAASPYGSGTPPTRGWAANVRTRSPCRQAAREAARRTTPPSPTPPAALEGHRLPLPRRAPPATPPAQRNGS